MPAGSSSSSWRWCWQQSGSRSSRRPSEAARARPRFEAVGSRSSPVDAHLIRKLGPKQLGEASLVGALWWYSAGVLYPAKALKWAGIQIVGPPVGDEPVGLPQSGLGRRFARSRNAVFLEEPSKHGRLVQEFDELAELYEGLVRPFSTPI